MITVFDLVQCMEKRYGSQTAAQYRDGNEVCTASYEKYVEDIRKFARYLYFTYGMVKGRHFGILAKNSYHYMVGIMGTMLAGGVVVPLNAEESREVMEYETEFADIDILFTDGEYEKREPEFAQKYGARIRGLWEYESCEAKPSQEPEQAADANALAMILFTSGTTGKNKGVMLSQKNLLSPVSSFEKAIIGFTDSNKFNQAKANNVLCIVPLYHISGIETMIMSNAMGNVIGICSQPKYMYRDLEAFQCDFAFVVPAILKLWVKDVRRGHRDRLGGIHTIVCGAAMIDEESMQSFWDNGIAVYQAYGLTEMCATGVTNTSNDIHKMKSVGRPEETCQIRLEDGEICMKGDSVMLGYYKKPDETAKTVEDGWLHTGDLGYFDEDGYLYLSGRKKNLIILESGENVNPEELEGILKQCSLIEEVLVEEREQKICARVCCKTGDQEKVRQFVADCNRGLAFFKRITVLEFQTEPLAKTTTGKLLRRKGKE